MDNNKTLSIIFAFFVLVAIVGFYITFDKIASLSTSVSNLELTLQIKNKGDLVAQNQIDTTPITSTSTPVQEPQAAPSQTDTVAKISTAIIFETLSSPALQPQATTTITVESVSKTSDGTIKINIKAFTPNASSYTAIDPTGLFWLVNLSGDNEMATQTIGQFQSIPPQSSTSGQLIFKPSTDRSSLILQVGNGDNAKFYEFDFTKMSYKETVIG